MPINDPGAGGGNGAAVAASSNYTLDKPFDVSFPLTASGVKRINEMFTLLFKQDTKNSAAIAAITPTTLFWTTVQKSSDEDGNNNRGAGNNNPADDVDLQFPMLVGRYQVRGMIHFQMDEQNTGNLLRHTFTGPSVNIFQGSVHHVNTTPAIATRVLDAFDSSTQTANPYESGASNTNGKLWFEFLIDTSASGTFKFRWVSGSSTAASMSVRKGSYIEYHKMG